MYLIYILLFLTLIFLLYIFSIKPNKKRNMDFLLGRLYAHRGLHDNKNENPENSMLSFEMAIEKNFGIEFDVQVTKDNIPVIFHDDNISRMCNIKNKINNLTFKEVQDLKLLDSNQHIPRLQEVLDLVDGRVPLIIEIKNDTNEIGELEYIGEILDNYKGIYVIESFNPLVLIWYKKNRPQIIRGQLSTKFKKKQRSFSRQFRDFLLTNFMINFLAKPDFIAFNYKYKNMFSFKLCKMLYSPISAAYTIKSQKSLKNNLNDFDLFIFDNFLPKEGTKIN